MEVILPLSTFRRDVLPLPLGPKRAITSPGLAAPLIALRTAGSLFPAAF
jgi:hypothetical protein